MTIPEGTITLTIYQSLSKQTKIPVKDFQAAAKDPVKLGVPEFWFKREDGKKGPKSLEGFLYPSTYEIPPKATAEQILSMMVDQFLERDQGDSTSSTGRRTTARSPRTRR